MCVCRMSENCKSLVLQDKCNIEIFLSPDFVNSSPDNIHFYLRIESEKFYEF